MKRIHTPAAIIQQQRKQLPFTVTDIPNNDIAAWKQNQVKKDIELQLLAKVNSAKQARRVAEGIAEGKTFEMSAFDRQEIAWIKSLSVRSTAPKQAPPVLYTTPKEPLISRLKSWAYKYFCDAFYK